MKNFLNKYNATKLETTKDESQLSLEGYKRRILKILDENIINFKNHSWNLSNRMNKLIIDGESNSVFTLRLGGKRIVRYSLEYLTDHQKLEFLSDFYASVQQGDFDEDIINFIAEEKEKAYRRKKECNARRRERKHNTQRMVVQSETIVTQPVIEAQKTKVGEVYPSLSRRARQLSPCFYKDFLFLKSSVKW